MLPASVPDRGETKIRNQIRSQDVERGHAGSFEEKGNLFNTTFTEKITPSSSTRLMILHMLFPSYDITYVIPTYVRHSHLG